MYDAAYHLNSDPFRLSPDHRFCFRHKSYARSKTYLDYALHRGEGFVMITGAPGSGKTTLLNDLLANADEINLVTARIVTTQLNATDLLRMVAFSFKINTQGLDKASILQHLERFLIEQYRLQRKPLLVIDEAQDLERSALEEMRLLTNMELNNQPLLQIFLVGQESLLEMIQDPKMEQLHQRLIASSHLTPMNIEETEVYVLHRLRTAGWRHDPLISRGALRRIHLFSRGVPRRINQVCSRFLLYGAVENKHRLDSKDAQEVINELRYEHLAPLTDNGPQDGLSDDVNPSIEMELLDGYDQEFLDSSGINNEQSDDGTLSQNQMSQNQNSPVVSLFPDSNNSASGKIINITDIVGRTGETNTRILAPSESRYPVYLKTYETSDPVRKSPNSTGAYKEHKSYMATSSILGLLLGIIIWIFPEELAVQPTTFTDNIVIQKNAAGNKVSQVKQLQKGSFTSIQYGIEKNLAEHAFIFEKSKQGVIKLQLNIDAQFSRGSTMASPTLQSKLIFLAKAIHDQQYAIIQVIGHCDNTGSQEKNISLSKLRAKVVADFLVLQGIPRNRLTTEGRGTDELISSTRPQLNRRVDLLVKTMMPGRVS